MTSNSSNSTALFEPIQVSAIEFFGILCAWLAYCLTSPWSAGQPLRLLVTFQGYVKIVLRPIFFRRWYMATSLFATYLMGRTSINWRRGSVVVLWLAMDTTALVVELVCRGVHATCIAPLKIATAIAE